MKIVEITRDPKNLAVPIIFRVGFATIADGPTVSEILYCRDGYSNGAKGRRPSYAVKFTDSPEIRVIAETEILDYVVLSDEEGKKKGTTNPEAVIPLPE